MDTIVIKTLQDTIFRIEFHKTADNCWHMILPRHCEYAAMNAMKYHDRMHTDKVATWQCGSLERLMVFVSDYIGKSEA